MVPCVTGRTSTFSGDAHSAAGALVHACAHAHTQERMVSGVMWLDPRGPYRTLSDLWDDADGGDLPVADDEHCNA